MTSGHSVVAFDHFEPVSLCEGFQRKETEEIEEEKAALAALGDPSLVILRLNAMCL